MTCLENKTDPTVLPVQHGRWKVPIEYKEEIGKVVRSEKFHTYLYGRTFMVETDHKLLEMISMKDPIAAPVRLQRMLLWLQQYDMTITYRPGKEMLLADALSRHLSQTDTQIKLNLRVDALFMSAFTRIHLMIAAETQWDPILSIVHRLTQWLAWQTHNVPRITRNYWDFQDKLSVEDDLLMKGERVIIHHPAETLSWTISMKAMQESTRHWPWVECVSTGQGWKLM